MNKIIMVLLALILVLSCQKDIPVKPPNTTIEVIKSVQDKVKIMGISDQKFSSLDWNNAMKTVDKEGIYIKVNNKENSKEALYYSLMGNIEQAYLITKDSSSLYVHNIKDVPIREFVVADNIVISSKELGGKADINNVIRNGSVSTSSEDYSLAGPKIKYDPPSNYAPPPPCITSFDGVVYDSYFLLYGGGGGTSSKWTPLYDKYGNTANGNVFRDTAIDKYNGITSLNPVSVTHMKDYDLYKCIDKKSFWYMNVTITYQLNTDGRTDGKRLTLMPATTEVTLTGVVAGSYKMNAQQYPSTINSGINNLYFNIQGIWECPIAADKLGVKVPMIISVSTNFTSPPTGTISYKTH